MAGNVRQRMIAGALDLLSRRGLQSTSFAEVTQATHTPRGSIYHHFPGGKQELVLEALDANARDFVTHVEQVPRQTPEEFAATLVTHLRHYIVESNYSAGCAAAAVTVAAENEEARHCAGADDAEFLGVEVGSPLLRVRRLTLSRDDRPLEYSDDRYLPNRATFTIENAVGRSSALLLHPVEDAS